MIRPDDPIGVRPEIRCRTPEPDSYVRTDVRTNEEPDTGRCDLYVPDAHARDRDSAIGTRAKTIYRQGHDVVIRLIASMAEDYAAALCHIGLAEDAAAIRHTAEQIETMKPRAAARRRAVDRWRHMVERCTRPEGDSWHLYGGRGIRVCQEWLDSFEAYYAHMGDPPFDGASVDRIDVNGHYEPGNVRWASAKEQRANQRYDPQLIKTHCPQGHPYDELNTYVPPGGGSRSCIKCQRAHKRAWRQRQAGA